MAMNPYVGWGVTTLLSWLINKSNKDKNNSSNDPDSLNLSAAQVGTPVPVIMGRTLLKTPLIIYYGDFSARAYTETYAAHANFSAWPILLTMLLEWALKPKTGNAVDSVTNGHAKDKHTHPQLRVTGQATLTGQNTPSGQHGHDVKETEGPNYLMALATWLLSWLINGRNLKTTVQKGFKYSLGYQMLACLSGSDIRLRGVYLKEQKVWEGNVSREEYQQGSFVVKVDNEELFGGPDEEGGFQGELHFYLGGAEQPADPWMIEQMQADTVQEELRGLTPAYRPFVSLVVPTAYIGKQASIPDTWLDLQWIPNRLGLGAIGEDANPAEAIYEMHVNEEWGLNREPALMDTDALLAVGKRLKEEGIGLTVPITAKTEVRQLIDNICEHLDMVRYTDPETGKLTFKLIRDDYDATNLPIFDETICSSVEFTRTVWSNTNGAICVSYTDSAAQYETSTVTANDPANIQINDGNNNGQDFDFKYFSTAGNARWAAQRELKQQGFPLAAATIICNRKGAFVRPGGVIKLNWPPYGIKDLILRVTDVDLGDFVQGEVEITCIEDVFGMGKSKYSPSDSTEWKPPQNYPTGVQLFHYLEAPWELMQVNDSFVFALAVRPDLKTQKWTIHRYRDSSWETTNSLTKWTPTGQLIGDYLATRDMEDVTGFEIFDLGGVYDLAARSLSTGTPGFTAARNGARLLMIDNEIMGWGNLVQMANGHWRVQNIIRATYDTVPVNHAAGTPVYFMDVGYYANVTTGGAVIPAGGIAAESYNMTTATSDANEAFDATKVKALTTRRRPERPIPPGRIRMSAHLQENMSYISQLAGNLHLSWALRNKKQSYGCVSQNDVSDFFSGLAIHPLDGLQTVIRAYVGSEKIHETILEASLEEVMIDGDGLETTQRQLITHFDYTWAQRCLDKLSFGVETRIEITAKLNGLESYQLHERTFTWKPSYVLGGCANEGEALALIQANWYNGGVIVRMPNEADNKQIPAENMPLIILGTLSANEQPGAVLCQSGWILPNGFVLAITSRLTCIPLELTAGFVLLSYFTPEDQGGVSAWQYNGTGFDRIGVPE